MDQILGWLLDHFILITLSVCVVVDCWFFRTVRRDMPMSAGKGLLLSVGMKIYAVLAAKVFFVLEWWDISRFSGMRIYGAVFFFPILIYGVARLARWDMRIAFDRLGICLIFGLMVVRLACIYNGCCRGNIIPGTDGIRWPLREMEMLLHFVLLVWYVPKAVNQKTIGQIYPIYMVTYGIFRFVIEGFREEYTPFGPLHMAHIWSVVSICIGLSVYFSLKPSRVRGSRKKAG